MKILNRWADLVIGKRRRVVGAILAVTVLAGYGAGKVRLNADFSTYLEQSNPLVRLYNYVGDAFGNNSIGVVLVTAPDVFQPDVMELADRLTDAYREVEGIAWVTSLTNVVDFRRSFGGIEVGRLVSRGELPRTEAEARRLEARVMAKDRLVGNLVSEDGTALAVMLRFGNRGGGADPAEYETATRIKAATEGVTSAVGLPEDTEVYFGGMPFLVYNMTLLISENMVVLTPLMLGVLLLVLFLGTRRWGGVVYPLAVVVVSVTWTVGLMGFLGLSLDLLTGIMPVILIALGCADGIHYMKRFYERRAEGDDPPEAARASLVEMGVPLILTTVTTMVGFAALTISDFAVIRQFGLLTALGLLLALIVTLTLLPALGSWGAGRPHRSRADGTGWWAGALARVVHRRSGTILAAGGVLGVASVVAIPRIVKDVDWTLCLERGSAPFHAEMLLREKFGGSLPIQVLVDGDIKDPVTLTAVRAVERRLGGLPLASRSQSIAGVIAEMNDVLNRRYAIPSDAAGVANLWFLIEDEELMEQMVAAEDRQALVQARLAEWTTASVSRSVDSLSAFLAGFPSRLVVVDPARLPPDRRGGVLAAHRREVAQALLWDLARWNAPAPDRDAVEGSVGRFFAWRPGASDWTALADRVGSYLSSPESELALDPDRARTLAGLVAERWRAGTVEGPDGIEEAVLTAHPEADPLDAEDVSLSLWLLGRDVLGRARVEAALADLAGIAPAVRDRAHLRRDAAGTLWEAAGSLWALDERIAEDLGVAAGPGVVRAVEARFERSGMASVLNQMEEELVPTQMTSILITLAVVIVVLGLVFRTVPGGFLAIAPLVLTILVNFAVMGYAGVGLDAFTAMVASIAIGLGIDYAIHFTHRFRKEWAKTGPDVERTLRQTFATSGLAIAVNAASVGLGFLVLLAAGGQHIRRFGGLSALTMLVAGVLTLTLLPALFVRLRPRFVMPRVREPGGRGTEEERTMRKLTAAGSIGLALLFALTPAPVEGQAGREILERVDSALNAPRDVSAVERMTLVDADGSQKQRSMRFRQKGPEKRLLHFLEPADVRGVGFLRLAEDRMYLYLPAFRRVRRIASSIKNEDFMGTDFSYEDMSLTRYGEDYRVTSAEGGDASGTYRLTLEPRPGADVSYARLVLEVNPSDWLPRTVEFYAGDGERIKTLTYSDVERIDGYAFGTRLEMVSWRSGHRTLVELEEIRFDTGVADDVFTERSLKRPG